MPRGFADLKAFPEFGDIGERKPRKSARDRPTVFHTGPRIYGLGSKPHVVGGPSEPPPNFLTAHNSRDEWDFFWAMAKVKGTPKDPRQPPFIGGEDWQYQVPASPTNLGLGIGRVAGGSVSDFVNLGPTGVPTIIRVQTERYHIFTNSIVQMKDLLISDDLRGVSAVINVYSSDWLGDPSGDAVCRIAALAIKGVQLPSPIRDRTAIRVRRPR